MRNNGAAIAGSAAAAHDVGGRSCSCKGRGRGEVVLVKQAMYSSSRVGSTPHGIDLCGS
jgi:hypothetical protein